MKASSRLVLVAIALLAVLAVAPAGAEEAPAVAEAAAPLAFEVTAPLVCAADLFSPASTQEPVGDWMDMLREDRFKSPHGFGFCPAPCAYDCPFCPFFQDCPAPSCSGWGACCDYGG